MIYKKTIKKHTNKNKIFNKNKNMFEKLKKQINYKKIPGKLGWLVVIFTISLFSNFNHFDNFWQANTLNLNGGTSFTGTSYPVKDSFFYTTMYLGSYSQPGVENVGSHGGVDFALPRGKSVLAIANGVVVESKLGNYGEGEFIVLKHSQVPDIDNPIKLTTYYSVYEHLSERKVATGEIVEVGDKIGEVWSTGYSTGNHLHLQIDTNDSLYHPYYSTDKAKVAANTINPLDWIDAHLDEDYQIDDSVYELDDNDISEIVDAVYNENENNASNEPSAIAEAQSKQKTKMFKLVTENYSLVDGQVWMDIIAVDSNNERDKEYVPLQEVRIIKDNLAMEVSDAKLTANDFENGKARIKITAEKEGIVNLLITDGYAAGHTFIKFIAQPEQVYKLGIELDELEENNQKVGVPFDIIVSTIGQDDMLVPYSNFMGQISFDAQNDDKERKLASFEPKTLRMQDFKMGKAKVSVTPLKESGEVKIKANSGVVIGYSEYLTFGEKDAQIFADLDTNDEYYKEVKFLKDNRIVEGYSDGTFKPANSISRAELLKVILLGFDYNIESKVVASYGDVSMAEWYSPYIQTAKKHDIAKGYPDGEFKPNQTVNRVEALKMILKTKEIAVPEVSVNLYPDVTKNDWFAPFVSVSKQYNLIDIDEDELFHPDKLLTRGEIAQIIYRIEKNDID